VNKLGLNLSNMSVRVMDTVLVMGKNGHSNGHSWTTDAGHATYSCGHSYIGRSGGYPV